MIMKKPIWVTLLIAVVFFVSCAKSPQEKIVGQWVDEDTQQGLTINADGTIFATEDGEIENEGTWKLNDIAPFILSIYEDGELEAEINVTFISDNEVEFKVENETIRMKRKEQKTDLP
jgi:hypothetical protein